MKSPQFHLLIGYMFLGISFLVDNPVRFLGLIVLAIFHFIIFNLEAKTELMQLKRDYLIQEIEKRKK